MKRKSQLSASMTLRQIDNGYWYAAELRLLKLRSDPRYHRMLARFEK